VPRILLIVVGGVAADRLHLQAILRVGNALQALALVSIAALDHIGVLSVRDLYAFAVVYGGLAAFTAPAADSLIPSLLPARVSATRECIALAGVERRSFLGPPAVTTLLVVALALRSRWSVLRRCAPQRCCHLVRSRPAVVSSEPRNRYSTRRGPG